MVQSSMITQSYRHQRKNGHLFISQAHQNSTSQQYKGRSEHINLPFKKGAIIEWRRFVLENERMDKLLTDLQMFQEEYDILPERRYVFNMFRMIYPTEVRVVIIGQSPYPGNCTITNIPYACGPAFLPNPACVTIPVTLRHILLELYRDMSMSPMKSPQEMFLSWIDQGVMLLNASLTCGINCPEYLKDQSTLWMEVMTHIVGEISKRVDPIFLLVGQHAWKFETYISSPCIKVSHPVSRVETATPWEGSNVFSQISKLMIEKGNVPIAWM